mmetsp:Transcript_30877/g.74610  ORF Transcript_30877/g.74610 Transcript_30877/m.74610 type:complete len:97 (+) Transcript_30877:969-1259(+)
MRMSVDLYLSTHAKMAIFSALQMKWKIFALIISVSTVQVSHLATILIMPVSVFTTVGIAIMEVAVLEINSERKLLDVVNSLLKGSKTSMAIVASVF